MGRFDSILNIGVYNPDKFIIFNLQWMGNGETIGVTTVDTVNGVVVEEVDGGLDIDGAIVGVVKEDMVGDCNW